MKFQDCVRLLGVFFDASLGWRSHTSYLERKCSQRFYILRRIRGFVSKEEFLTVYNGIIRSLLEYAGPVFIGLGVGDSRRLQRIQERCLRMIGTHPSTIEDLTTRRKKLALHFLDNIQRQDTIIKDLLPPLLPSGRFCVPFCHTKFRQKSYFPTICIIMSLSHCD